MSTFHEEVDKLRALYPQERSAVMPVLRLAQEEHGGWLPPEALEQVAGALDLTPAQVEAVASFYDMFFLEPVGRHVVEVCTNVSCCLVGALDVVAAFEQELDCRLGETSPDGTATLRSVECLGGCGWGPVVSVDHRYLEHFTPDDARTVVAGLRSGEGGH